MKVTKVNIKDIKNILDGYTKSNILYIDIEIVDGANTIKIYPVLNKDEEDFDFTKIIA